MLKRVNLGKCDFIKAFTFDNLLLVKLKLYKNGACMKAID